MNVFLHNKNNLKKNIISYILALIPLYLYGFYKNGIILYNKDYISFFGMFKIFYLLIINILLYFITNKILKKNISFDLIFLSIFIIPLFMPFNINLLVYILVMFLGLLFRKYYNVSLVILILSIFFSFLNPAEADNIYAFNTWDLLFGRNIGGLASTSIVIGIIIAIYLAITNNYKYLITLSGVIIFILLSILFKDYSFLTSGNAYLSLIFLAPWSDKSPYLKKYMLIYGALIGVLGFIFMHFINPYYGMVLAITIISIIYIAIEKKLFKVWFYWYFLIKYLCKGEFLWKVILSFIKIFFNA